MADIATKRSAGDLAICGGDAAFAAPLHVGRPNIGDRVRLHERLDEILDRRVLTNDGPLVQQFERVVADVAGVRHCVAVCNATAALSLLVRARGLSGEVIVPSFTFIATAHVLQWDGITPAFCDVDPRTHNIDVRAVERLITPRTTGILGVHVWGRGCDVEALDAVARKNGLALIYDAAHGFGCSVAGGRPIGSFGNAEVFSFHATKHVNAFEGGAVVTDDDALADRVRLMRNFGFVGYDETAVTGINAKMTEISAAMGLTSIEAASDVVAVNRRNYAEYRKRLETVPGITVAAYDEREQCNYHYVVLEVDAASSGVSRDLLQRVLWAENVMARRYFHPGCHRMEPYAALYPAAGMHLPVTESLTNRVLCLPTGTAVTLADVQSVCSIIAMTVRHAELVTRVAGDEMAIVSGPGDSASV